MFIIAIMFYNNKLFEANIFCLSHISDTVNMFLVHFTTLWIIIEEINWADEIKCSKSRFN